MAATQTPQVATGRQAARNVFGAALAMAAVVGVVLAMDHYVEPWKAGLEATKQDAIVRAHACVDTGVVVTNAWWQESLWRCDDTHRQFRFSQRELAAALPH